MKLRYKKQAYQTDAVNAVIDVLELINLNKGNGSTLYIGNVHADRRDKCRQPRAVSFI